MRTVNLLRILTSLVLATGLALASFSSLAHEKEAHATGKSGRVPMPFLNINTDKGDKCVQPEDIMRRDHMKFILHQRDKTMHEGIRTTQYSLKNCIDCHADVKTGSVLGKDGFCESCHRYAAVQLDCFECHSALRDASVLKNGAATAPPSAVRALNVSQKKASEPAKGMKP
jgi:hypothetical protein